MKRIAPWIAGTLVIGTFGFLLWLERRRPLRKRVEPALRHHVRNFVIAAAGALSVIVMETPLVQPLARLVESRRWGVLRSLGLPFWVEASLAIVLMDYTFYIWHVL